MRENSPSANSSDALAFMTSGTALGSNAAPSRSPSRASICEALASASWSCAEASAGETRIRTVPSLTRVPRSTGVAMTRPPNSALTSASSSARSEPVTLMKRSIDRLSTAAVVMATGSGLLATASSADVRDEQPLAAAATAKRAEKRRTE